VKIYVAAVGEDAMASLQYPPSTLISKGSIDRRRWPGVGLGRERNL
jgi:hypothetical protein